MTFNAPWGTSLKLMTGFLVLILVGVSLIGMFTGPEHNVVWIHGVTVMPLMILIIAAFFMIRGYVLTNNTLVIRRLGWNSKLDLTDLNSAQVDPKAMAKSIRTCGNGGMFCFAGTFCNKKLGSYRAFATSPKRSVVLRFTRRTVVVTPDKPEEFVIQIKKLRGLS